MNEETIALALKELSIDMRWIKTQMSNHLAHHQRYQYLLITALLSLIGAVVVAIIV